MKVKLKLIITFLHLPSTSAQGLIEYIEYSSLGRKARNTTIADVKL